MKPSKALVVGLVFSVHGHQVVVSDQSEAMAMGPDSASSMLSDFSVNSSNILAGEVCMADSLNTGCSMILNEPGSTAGQFPSFQSECIDVDVDVGGVVFPVTRCFGI